MGSLQVSGTVYDPSGNPAADARVVVVPAWGMVDSELTDTNGEYTLHWQNQQGMRNVKYFVVARDTERNLAGMEPIDAKKTNASVHLQAGFSISGTVLDTNGMPLRQANVNLNILLGDMGGMVDQRPVGVDADGNFTISALPPGQQYGVYISSSGYGSRNKMISKAQSRSNSIQLPPFKLRVADREIAGRVLDKDGKPLSGAWVNVYGNNQPGSNMRTDSEGHFKFKVCSGPIYVSANSQNGGQYGWGQTEARGGEMNVVVKMGDTGQRGPRATVHHLLPQPWTLGALIAWPASHQTGAVVLLSLQMAVLLGTGGGIFWFTRKPR